MNVQQLIEGEEGRRHDAYQDTRGIWTIGIGHTGPEVHEGLVWSDDLIDRTFGADVCHALDGLAAALPWWDQLDTVRKSYVISMAFQMGVKGVLGFKNTLDFLRQKKWDLAAAGVRNSLWHKQTFQRAERCAKAFETGEWQ